MTRTKLEAALAQAEDELSRTEDDLEQQEGYTADVWSPSVLRAVGWQ